MHENNSPNIAGSTDKKVLFYSFSSVTILTPGSGMAVSVREDEKS